MKIQASEIVLESVERIVPNPKNMNEHSDDQIDRLCKLIEYQGFRNPCIISKRTGYLVVGHGRLIAAKKLNMKKIPVIYQEFENEAQEYSYLVSDNAIAEWSDLDLSQINTDIIDFGPELDIDMLGIENFTIEVADKSPEIKDLSDDDVSIYCIEVRLINEMDQQDLYDDLTSKGFSCKVMSI